MDESKNFDPVVKGEWALPFDKQMTKKDHCCTKTRALYAGANHLAVVA